MNADRLLRVTGPHQHLVVSTPGELTDFAWSLERSSERKTAVRFLRGAKMETVPQLFDEFAAALQFPYYFGENWDALEECVCDLEWLPNDPCLLFFTDANRLLVREPGEKLALLLDVLESAAKSWALDESPSREQLGRPFHAVYQCSADDEAAFVARVDACGCSLDRLV
jgi:RNAse (barnase) inhibitor barstar